MIEAFVNSSDSQTKNKFAQLARVIEVISMRRPVKSGRVWPRLASIGKQGYNMSLGCGGMWQQMLRSMLANVGGTFGSNMARGKRWPNSANFGKPRQMLGTVPLGFRDVRRRLEILRDVNTCCFNSCSNCSCFRIGSSIQEVDQVVAHGLERGAFRIWGGNGR